MSHHRKRIGATAVEFAIILPLLMLLVIGLCIAQVSVFRQEQITSLSLAGARWASVHGPEYARQNNTTQATSEHVLTQVIHPNLQGLNANAMSCHVEWDEAGRIVTVTLNYQMGTMPFLGKISLHGQSTMLCTY